MPHFSPTQQEGHTGETIAADLLRAKGYRILERNFRCREGELDLIALHRGVIVFVEVKLRRSNTFGTAAEAITRTKLRRLQAAAGRWRQEHRSFRPFRFEVVAIDQTHAGTTIRHLDSL